MRTSLRPLATLAAVIACAGALAAQQTSAPPAPARDAVVKPSVGTATIVGTVVTDEAAPRPVRRAVVSLAASGVISVQRMATTDESGRFTFARLPAGNYSAPRVSKAGFVTASYGEKRPTGIGTPITLAEGQRLTIAMKMLHGGVITGTIFDELNRPMPSVTVQATMVKMVNGQRTSSGGIFGGGYSTDDRGIYRIYGLAPGDYVVSVSPRLGVNSELRPVTDAEIKWAQQQIHPGGPAAPAAPVTMPKPAQAITYTVMYYPGTADPAAASTVTVVAGQERAGVDFSASLVPTSRVSGTIVDPNGGPPLNAQLNLVPKIDTAVVADSFFFLDSVMLNRPTVVNGTFSMVGVKPGEYTLTARAAPRPPGGGVAPSGRGAGPAPLSLWAMEDVTVNGSDITGVELRLQPGMTMSGRVVFDGSVLPPPTDLSRASVRLSSAPSAGVTVTVGGSSSPIAADGTFKIEGVTPGRYFVSASAGGAIPGAGAASWTVRSAMAGGVDAADSPIEVKPDQDVSDVVVTFTDKQAELSGTLFDGAGHSTSDFSIILFPTTRSMWTQRSRRLRPPVRTSTEGKFKITNLLPGEYYLAALSDFEPNDYYNPTFLEQVAATAMKVTLVEGEKKVQDVKLAGGGTK